MKILILSDDFPPRSFGGGGIIASWQALELARRGHDVHVITTVQDKALERKIVRGGFTINQIYSKYPSILRDYISFYNPWTIFKIAKILRALRPDIVHIHNVHIHISYHSIFLAKQFSKKVFMTAHDTMPIHLGKLYPRLSFDTHSNRIFDYRVSLKELLKEYGLRVNPFRGFFIKSHFKKFDKIFAVSDALTESFRQNGIENVETMHNGIDISSFSVNTEKITEFKNKYDLQHKKVMFFGGRISIAKGGRVAINLLIELNKIMPDILLLIVGQRDQRINDLLTKARVAGVEAKVKFTGWLDRTEIISAYGASDVVLVPSLYLDPFPTINLEAMASRKPVIGTCFGGTPEVVFDGKTGFIVDPNDITTCIEKTKLILDDKNLSERFGEVGQKTIGSQFSLSKQIDALEAIYGNIQDHE